MFSLESAPRSCPSSPKKTMFVRPNALWAPLFPKLSEAATVCVDEHWVIFASPWAVMLVNGIFGPFEGWLSLIRLSCGFVSHLRVILSFNSVREIEPSIPWPLLQLFHFHTFPLLILWVLTFSVDVTLIASRVPMLLHFCCCRLFSERSFQFVMTLSGFLFRHLFSEESIPRHQCSPQTFSNTRVTLLVSCFLSFHCLFNLFWISFQSLFNLLSTSFNLFWISFCVTTLLSLITQRTLASVGTSSRVARSQDLRFV